MVLCGHLYSIFSFFIEIQLSSSIVLVSCVQQSHSVVYVCIYIYVYIIFQIIFQYRL